MARGGLPFCTAKCKPERVFGIVREGAVQRFGIVLTGADLRPRQVEISAERAIRHAGHRQAANEHDAGEALRQRPAKPRSHVGNVANVATS